MSIQETIDTSLEVLVIPSEKDKIEEVLKYALSYPELYTVEQIETKIHFKYLLNYLFYDIDGLNIKTIVIEKNYTSESYLDDYFNYYSKCYHSYKKQCRRIHFFDTSFEKQKFIEVLTINKKEEIWSSYQGHIVIKPLPKGVIGASLISPYKNKDKRYYTATREYNVTLFGKKLKIKTMPYQEQDSIVGSCASASLWFAFHITLIILTFTMRILDQRLKNLNFFLLGFLTVIKAQVPVHTRIWLFCLMKIVS